MKVSWFVVLRVIGLVVRKYICASLQPAPSRVNEGVVDFIYVLFRSEDG